jgi:hypothetical protein
MLTVATEAGSANGQCDALMTQVLALSITGDLDGTETAAREIRQRAHDAGYAFGQFGAAGALARVALLRGRFDEAFEHIEEQQQHVMSAGDAGRYLVLSHRIVAATHQGLDEDAARLLQQALEECSPVIITAVGADVRRVYYEHRTGELRSKLAEWWTTVAPMLPAIVRLGILIDVARTFPHAGDEAIATSVYSELLPHAGRWPIGSEEAMDAVTDHALGWCAVTTRDLDRAEQHFRDAFALYARAGALALLITAAIDLHTIGRSDPPTLAHARRAADELNLPIQAQKLSPT